MVSPSHSRRNSGEILIDDTETLSDVANRSLQETAREIKRGITEEKANQLIKQVMQAWDSPESKQLRDSVGTDKNGWETFIDRADWIYQKTGKQFYYYRLTLVALKILFPFLGSEIIALLTLGVYFTEDKVVEKMGSYFQTLHMENTPEFKTSRLLNIETIDFIKRILKVIKVGGGILFYIAYRITQLGVCAELSPMPLNFYNDEGRKRFSLDVRIFAGLYVCYTIFQEKSIASNMWQNFHAREVLSYVIPKEFEEDSLFKDSICSLSQRSPLFPARLSKCKQHWFNLSLLLEHLETHDFCPNCKAQVDEDNTPIFDLEKFIEFRNFLQTKIN
jgi:hypothetical protein